MQSVDVMDNQSDLPQVIFEEMPEDSRSLVEVCLHVHGFCTGSKGCIRPHVQQAACNFWSDKIHNYKRVNGVKGVIRVKQDTQALPRRKVSKKPAPPRRTMSDGIKNHRVAECLTSQAHKAKLQATGLASLDTGASRSVIGEERLRCLAKVARVCAQVGQRMPKQSWFSVWQQSCSIQLQTTADSVDSWQTMHMAFD